MEEKHEHSGSGHAQEGTIDEAMLMGVEQMGEGSGMPHVGCQTPETARNSQSLGATSGK